VIGTTQLVEAEADTALIVSTASHRGIDTAVIYTAIVISVTELAQTLIVVINPNFPLQQLVC
jgi:hypothetical protein